MRCLSEEDEVIRSEMIKVCQDLYHPVDNDESEKYFLVEGKSSESVEKEIMEHMEPKYAKPKFVNAYAYICDVGYNTLIKFD